MSHTSSAVVSDPENPAQGRRLTVYYDGLCYLCYGEIAHYKTLPDAAAIDFVDITTTGFDAEAHGLDPKRVHQVMHVRRKDGTLATEVEAFVAIWDELERYHLAARIARMPGMTTLLGIGYRAFARIRPYLPKRKRAPGEPDCAASPYCETPQKPVAPNREDTRGDTP